MEATWYGQSDGKGKCDESLKFGTSPSGCESRPVKAQPGRPVVSLAAAWATKPLMRRYTSMWAVGLHPRKDRISRAQGFMISEGSSHRDRKVGLGRWHAAGCSTMARMKRETWLAGRPSCLLWEESVQRRADDPSLNGHAFVATGVFRLRTSSNTEVGRWRGEPELRSMGMRESEGRIGAMTSGNSWQLDPNEQRRPVLEVNYRRER